MKQQKIFRKLSTAWLDQQVYVEEWWNIGLERKQQAEEEVFCVAEDYT